jgi:MFS family permease
MVESFGIPLNEVGKWAGLCSATFSLSQAVMGVPWGRFSDRYGRKPAILFGLTSTMITLLIWGFSTNLAMAIVARALAGAANGNVGILRTTVAEMVPYKELQPFAFSLMPLVWNVGSVFGPMLGGALANPLNVKPTERRMEGSLLQRYPYALPNIVAACLFAIGIFSGIFFLEETMEAAKDRKDYGLVIGRKLTRGLDSVWRNATRIFRSRPQPDEQTEGLESEPLLPANNVDDEENGTVKVNNPAKKSSPPGWREVLTPQAVMNLVVYTMLACHTMAFDQLIPVYLQHNPIGTPDSTPYSPPLKFSGGFGLDHFTIGMISTCNGIVGMIFQFFVFPPLARRFGALFCLKIVVCVFPVAYFLTPFTALLPTQQAQVGCQLALMIIKNMAGTFAFPCSTILLTNSASSLRTLGTLNGMATSTAALGRAAGPATAGAMFSFGVKRGYIIFPWWLITIFSVLSAVPAFWLIEGKGFGGDADEEQDEDDAGERGDENSNGPSIEAAARQGHAKASDAAGPVIVPDTAGPTEREEAAYGGFAPLARATSSNSNVLTEEDDPVPEGLRPIRKLSMPIGTGRQGISRRFSSNLGSSFGSAGNQGGQ